MTLIEAATSRRPYKRTTERTWRQPHHAQVFSPEDIAATDYEVEGAPEEFAVTKSELAQAFNIGVAGDRSEFRAFERNITARGRIVK